MGKAPAAYKQIMLEVHEGRLTALYKLCFSVSSHELYAAEMRRKRKTESWADFGDDICALADKAFAN